MSYCEHLHSEARWFFSDAEPKFFRFEYYYCKDCEQIFFPLKTAQHILNYYRYEDIRSALLTESFRDISEFKKAV